MCEEDERDNKTWSHLHVAAAEGHHEVVKYLLDQGDDVNMRSGIHHLTPLILASRSERLMACETLIDHPGCGINAQDKDGRSALHEGAQTGNVQICKKLLDNGAVVDIQTNMQVTPLHLAVKFGSLMVVKLLLTNGADPGAKTKEGKSPRALAVEAGNLDILHHLDDILKVEDASTEDDLDAVFPVKKGHCCSTLTTIKHISSDGHGLVFEAYTKHGVFAIRRIALHNASKKSLTEMLDLVHMSHQNIVIVHDSWQENIETSKQQDWDLKHFTQQICKRQVYLAGTSHYLYLQMELCKTETLEHYIRKNRSKVDQQQFLSYFVQIVSALQYIHGEGHIHRDLKASSVYFAMDGTVKLGDFGVAKEIAGYPIQSPTTYHSHNRGSATILFAACTEQTDFKSDIFALGVIFYLGMTSFPSDFTRSDQQRALDTLKAGSDNVMPYLFAEQNPPNRQELLRSMCRRDPDQRPSADDVDKCISEWTNDDKSSETTEPSSPQETQVSLSYVQECLVSSSTRTNSEGISPTTSTIDELLFEPVPTTSIVVDEKATTIRQHALDFYRAGRYNMASASFKELLRHQEDTHQECLRTKINLAISLADEGRYDDAFRLCQEMLRTIEHHEDTLRIRHVTAYVLNLMSKHDKTVYQQVLEQQIQLLGPDHPETLGTIHNIGLVLHKHGKFTEAYRVCTHVLNKRIQVLGSNDHETLSTKHNVALVLQELGKYMEALKVYSEVADVQKMHDHPHTLSTMHGIAYVLKCQGKYDQALQLFKEVLTKQCPDHPDTLVTRHNIASTLHDQGKYDDALNLYNDVLAMRQKVLGSDHPDTLSTMHNIASTLQSLGNFQDALVAYQDVLTKREIILGVDHPNTLTTKNNVAGILARTGRHDDAVATYKHVLDKREAALGTGHPNTLSTMLNMAGALTRQKKYVEALNVYKKVLGKQEATLGCEHTDTLRTKHYVAMTEEFLMKLQGVS